MQSVRINNSETILCDCTATLSSLSFMINREQSAGHHRMIGRTEDSKQRKENKMINILVVEDDHDLNRIVCTYLNDSGFNAKGCLNASDAYDEMYNSLYELVVSDIMMPEIDGFEFAENVRRINRNIPILFMSARDDLTSKKRGFQLGIDTTTSLRAVDVYVTKLRDKFADCDGFRIATVRGLGYKAVLS